MSDANSRVEDYSYQEIMQGLERFKEKFPAAYRWFFIWEMEMLHGTRESDPGLDQEQEADSGST